ncbi:MAG: methyltransferase C-terminal domain-containing protein [Thiohalophilus sp.]|nr:methyltransferase C-terminal domain-containing protein [Thiohalophilus sp.]MDZ7804395.1 methyltransferase C-terminal domain-containing protein [Thiohalophilus sp.]
MRVFAQRSDTGTQPATSAVGNLRKREEEAGMRTLAFYADFQPRAEAVKDDLLSFLIQARREGKRVAAYGAAAKGNTLLNFAGVRSDLIRMVADKNPAKQGKYMPGSRIPILLPDEVLATRPD